MTRSKCPQILFASHLPRTPSGGGLYTVTWHINEILESHFRVQNPGQIETPVSTLDAAISKLRRHILRLPSNFHTFSPFVLESIAVYLEQLPKKGIDALFFRSSTRWCAYRPTLPYFVHTDVCFHTFFHNTFSEHDFHKQDLQRIYAFNPLFPFPDRLPSVFTALGEKAIS
jgi:hypothetical protein